MKIRTQVSRHKVLPLVEVDIKAVMVLPQVVYKATFQELADFLLNFDEETRTVLFKEISRYVGQL